MNPPSPPPSILPPPSPSRPPLPGESRLRAGPTRRPPRSSMPTKTSGSFALRRGNLRAADWDDVAASLPTFGGPAKTAIQCRHKIEKLRKRYRGEKQRCLTKPGKFSSSWDLFPVLDAMEFVSVTSNRTIRMWIARTRVTVGMDLGLDRRDPWCVRLVTGLGLEVRFRVKSQMRMYGGFKPEFDSDHDSGGGFGSKRRYNGHQKFSADSDDEILLAPRATRLRGSHGKLSSGEFSRRWWVSVEVAW